MTRARQHILALMFLLPALALYIPLPAGNALANGSHADSIEAYYGSVENLVVRVEAIPIVGDLHLVVYLTQKDDTPVQGAQVQATAVGPGDNPLRLGPSFNIPQTEYDPSLYSVTLPGALEKGPWNITLLIKPESPDQESEINFPITLTEPSNYNELLIAVLAAFLIFLAWMLWSWRRQAARRRRTG